MPLQWTEVGHSICKPEARDLKSTMRTEENPRDEKG